MEKPKAKENPQQKKRKKKQAHRRKKAYHSVKKRKQFLCESDWYWRSYSNFRCRYLDNQQNIEKA